MNAKRSFVAGVVGALAMSVLLLFAREMGVPANISMLLGTMFGWVPSPATWTIGLLIHALIGGLLAQVYGWAFETLTHEAGAAVGAGLGVIHGLVAGTMLAWVPMVHPRVPELLPAPGPFMSNLGIEGIFAFILLHFVYGAIVGVLYGPLHSKQPLEVSEL